MKTRHINAGFPVQFPVLRRGSREWCLTCVPCWNRAEPRSEASVGEAIGTFADGTWRLDMKTAFAALALLLASATAACNTVEGVGEDVTAVGQTIDDAAEDAN